MLREILLYCMIIWDQNDKRFPKVYNSAPVLCSYDDSDYLCLGITCCFGNAIFQLNFSDVLQCNDLMSKKICVSAVSMDTKPPACWKDVLLLIATWGEVKQKVFDSLPPFVMMRVICD